MTRDVRIISPNETIADAARQWPRSMLARFR
jgi:hypothetical protein